MGVINLLPLIFGLLAHHWHVWQGCSFDELGRHDYLQLDFISPLCNTTLPDTSYACA